MTPDYVSLRNRPPLDLSTAVKGSKVKFRNGGTATIEAIEALDLCTWFDVRFEGDESEGWVFYPNGQLEKSRTSIVDIVAIEPPAFDWKDVKPGMAFHWPEGTKNQNDQWIYIYSGKCVLTQKPLFACKPKHYSDRRTECASDFPDGFFDTAIRAPEHDIGQP